MTYSYSRQPSRWIPWPTGSKWVDGKSIIFQWAWSNWINYTKWDLVSYSDWKVYHADINNVWYQPDISSSVWSEFIDLSVTVWWIQSQINSHESNISNPHGVTKAQVGLSNVDNTSDANKPISTATQTALDGKVDKVSSTDNALTRFDGTSWTIQSWNITESDNWDIGWANSISYDITPTSVPSSEGITSWNTTEKTLEINHGNDVIQQVWQEQYWRGKNQSWATISQPSVVYASWAVGMSWIMTIDKYIADGSISGIYVLGITTEDIANGWDWFVATFWKIRGINTTWTPYGETWAEWDVLYASPTVAWELTNVKPSLPNIILPIGFVITTHAVVGTIAVRVPTPHSIADEVGYDNTTSWLTAIDVQSAIDELESSKEDAFSKNTAFNKNFWTTAWTVLEGDNATNILNLWYLNSISDFNNKALNWNTLKIVCFGDSITYWYNPSAGGAQIANPYPAELQTKLRLWYNNNNITVVNKWVSWDKASDLVARYDTDVVAQTPDLVIQMIGINDSNNSVTIGTFTSNLEELWKKAYLNGITTIFVTPTPIKRETTGAGNNNYRLWFYAQAVKSVADKFKIPIIDMYGEFESIFNWGNTYTVWNFLPVSWDTLHPTQAGYNLISDIILADIIPCERVRWDRAETHIPIVSSQFWFSNITSASDIFEVSGNVYTKNYILRKSVTWKYCRVAIYIWKRGYGLYANGAKNTAGTTAGIRENGTLWVYSLNFNNWVLTSNVEDLLNSNVWLGMHILEFNSTDFSLWDAAWAQWYPTAFIVK